MNDLSLLAICQQNKFGNIYFHNNKKNLPSQTFHRNRRDLISTRHRCHHLIDANSKAKPKKRPIKTGINENDY